MPWVIYESLEFDPNRISKAGKKYSAYVMKGIKKGYMEEDAPYEKIFFENSAATIIEKGVARPNVSIVQFLQKGCNPGDLLVIKNVRIGGKWELESIENRSKSSEVNDYMPLTANDIAEFKKSALPYEEDPTRPAAPAIPQMAPLNYTPATE